MLLHSPAAGRIRGPQSRTAAPGMSRRHCSMPPTRRRCRTRTMSAPFWPVMSARKRGCFSTRQPPPCTRGLQSQTAAPETSHHHCSVPPTPRHCRRRRCQPYRCRSRREQTRMLLHSPAAGLVMPRSAITNRGSWKTSRRHYSAPSTPRGRRIRRCQRGPSPVISARKRGCWLDHHPPVGPSHCASELFDVARAKQHCQVVGELRARNLLKKLPREADEHAIHGHRGVVRRQVLHERTEATNHKSAGSVPDIAASSQPGAGYHLADVGGADVRELIRQGFAQCQCASQRG